MEITLEMVERLREKAPVSYGQAKRALEYSGGNLLDALIYLEEQGAIPRQEGAYFTTRGGNSPPPPEPRDLPVPAQEPAGKKGKEKRRSRPGSGSRPLSCGPCAGGSSTTSWRSGAGTSRSPLCRC